MPEIHVVTGASSGVGRALCAHIAAKGDHVLGLARRADELEALRATDPDRITVLPCDLGTPDGRSAACNAVPEGFAVRSLVHSAAIAPHDRMQDLTDEGYRRTMAINLDAPILLTRDLLPRMAERGRVLHLSSGSAYRTNPGGGLYSITKAALLMAKAAWNADLPRGGVIVGSAMPGVVDGPMQDAARADTNPSAALFRGFQADGRLLRPERVAEFLYWLLTGTDDEAFAAGDWNVFDEAHHPHWLVGPINA
ncbi:SDR family oxidoreductase [Croceicoccus naphthovorans]|uniref:Uncharacterized protein n=1 Tax=Croceicoccus naphthovorans TaxID=1348774 RepID=A0A0G3XGQ0_9SPHN|nr:SDR family oxidoreductase [Croceicoccus naphthovorans]AKM09518.1 hypothetical protein AB433_05230 [Croceicoccus naphthovorans]MBB3989740.1 NAD(P)-dependent dehydrogenase (short-subunit alcohol dehydrogenase family) [Croceicoccus naphthovorans]